MNSKLVIISFLVLLISNICKAQLDSTGGNTDPEDEKPAVQWVNPHKYPSLMWEITGNGLKKPSYLYGTMHVSRKIVFRLSDSFFKALKSVDVVALESNANKWLDELAQEGYSGGFRNFGYFNDYGYGGYSNNFYKNAFTVSFPKKSTFEYLLRRQEDLADWMIFRESDNTRNYSERTFLDMFIHQAGMKLGKTVTGLEEYQISRKMVKKANKRDWKSEKKNKKRRQDYSEYGENSIWEQIEDAYRNQDLDLLDSLETLTSPSKNFTRWMLWKRNEVMALSMDSIMRKAGLSIFAGIGAAHVPGDSGVVVLLRKLGYTVTPKRGEFNEWAIKEKEKIDKMQYKQTLKEYVSPNKDFKAQMPGVPLDYKQGDRNEYFYADLGNGAYYTVTRMPFYGALSNQTSEFVLKRIDSLFFENVPGHKGNKSKKIKKNGFPGWDLTTKTELGDMHRYQVIATPTYLWFIKMVGQGDFVDGKNSDEFFNSFDILEKPENNWQKYSPPTGEYEINWPTKITREKSVRDTSHQLLGHIDIDAIDKDGNYYFLKTADDRMVDNYFEEDSFDLSELSTAMYKSLKGEKIKRKFLTVQGYPAIDISFYSNLAKDNIHLRYISKGKLFYLVGAKTSSSKMPENYFNSFKFIKNNYHKEYSWQTDSVLKFKTKTIEIENYGKPKKQDEDEDDMYSYYRYRDAEPLKDSLNLMDKREYQYYQYTTGEYVSVSYNKSSPFQMTNISADSFIRMQKRYAKKSGLKILKADSFFIGTKWKAIDFKYTDTNSSKITWTRVLDKGRIGYYLNTYYDSIGGPGEFVNNFINNFTPFDTFIYSPIPKNKLMDSLMNGCFNKDSLSKLIHRNLAQYYYDVKKENVTKAIAFINKLNRNETKFEENRLYADLLRGIIRTNTPEGKAFIKHLYKSAGDSSEFQTEILEKLTYKSTKENAQLAIELLMEETPLVENNYNNSSVFSNYYDTFKNAKPFYPQAFELIRYDEYRSSVIELAAILLDSNIIKPEDYLAHKNSLLIDFRDYLKRERASETKSSNYYSPSDEEEDKDDQEKYGSSYVSESKSNSLKEQRNEYGYGGYGEIDGIFNGSEGNYYGRSDRKYENYGLVEGLARLMVPFYNSDEKVKQRMDKLLMSPKRKQKFDYLLFFFKHKLPFNDTLTTYFLKRRDYAWGIAKRLYVNKMTTKIPTDFKDIQKYLEYFITYKEMGPKDTIKFIEKRNMKINGIDGYGYFWKHKFKNSRYSDDWYWDFAWVAKDSLNSMRYKEPAYWFCNKNLNNKKSFEDQYKVFYEYISKFKRRKWDEDADDQKRRYYGW